MMIEPAVKAPGPRRLAACVLAALLSPPVFGQTTPLLDERYIDAIQSEISGDLAKQHIHMMAPYERNRPESEYSGNFLETSYMIAKLREYGVSDSRVEKLPAAGALWDGEFGELWMEEPVRERVASYDEIAASLVRGSASVDLRAELVSAGSGARAEDYQGKDVRGKIILAKSPAEAVYQLAVVERGAAGIVSYDASAGQRYPKQVRWQSLSRAAPPAGGSTAFGFAVSSLVGARLAAFLDQGRRVVLHAKTETRKFPGKYEAVTGKIPGEAFPEDGFLFFGHLFEGIAKQGANDNISGPATELEVARALVKLQQQGRIPKFRRPVRFLWTQEIGGTTAYLDKFPAENRALKAGINMDMVGEGLADQHGVFHVAATPYSQPHFINDITRAVAEMTILLNNDANARFPGNQYGKFANKVVSPTGSDDIFWCDFLPYDGGSDNGPLNRPEYNIPTAYYEVWPDSSYHTNDDVAAHSDATQLKRVAFMAAVSATIYATATPESVARSLPEFVSRAQGRIVEQLKRGGEMLAMAKDPGLGEAHRLARLVLEEAHEREAKTLESLAMLTRESAEVTAQVRDEAGRMRADLARSLETLRRFHRYQCRVRGVAETEPPAPPLEAELAKVMPRRVKRDEGPAGLAKGNTVVATRYAAYELYNYLDGQRSIYEIWRKLYAEFGAVTLTDVRDYIFAHVKAGNIQIR